MTLGRDGRGAVSSRHTPLSLLTVCFIVALKPDILFRLKKGGEGGREREKKASNSKDVK